MRELPPVFQNWISNRGWSLHPHQIAMLNSAELPANLLIAPTGGGKTLAGFLPSLIEITENSHVGLHTLYISPLKALAADIKRNLKNPVNEMGLPIRIDDRTGDTSYTKKRQQRADPPHILLTTPESLALMLSYEDCARTFAGLQRVIIDEIHALAESKRGDQLMLCISRLQALCPNIRRVGLSATVEDPEAMARYLAQAPSLSPIQYADPGPDPDISMLETETAPPWSGGGAAYAIPEVLEQVRQHKTTLIFHNTRAQAEIFFHNLWMVNTEGLPIGIHHGSLDRAQRDKVEAAMVAGHLRAIVCTGSLDLGIDWGDVDLVIQIGAPKNVKRLVQRIGRANHQFNAPSKAILVPANRFEIIECVAALEAVKDKELDGNPRGPGPLDVLTQHILVRATSGPFNADHLFQEIKTVGAYQSITRQEFDTCLEYCATGGYALKRYDQWRRLKQNADGQWHLRDPRSAQNIRMNIGTIQDTDTLKVKLRGGRGGKILGEVEEAFAATLIKGDTFLIGGEIVRYEGLRDVVVEVSRDAKKKPKIATFSGSKFSTSTQLSHRILRMFEARNWDMLPNHTQKWLQLQAEMSKLPTSQNLLLETFEHDGRHHLCLYGFAGRNALQTLGLLLTHRMEKADLHPMGFVATDYALLIWGLDPISDPAALMSPDGLREGLDTWLAGNAVMKRTFRTTAIIACLIERNTTSSRKSGRQTLFSSDILYDTLRKYDPDHLLLSITKTEALRGLVDFGRIEEMLTRTRGRITHVETSGITPLSAPLFLEVGKIPIKGAAEDRLLLEAANAVLSKTGHEK
ncbi:MAG: ligase-associated DNA damage response DEXH box helicase [Pseudoruegeria sp.]